MADDVPPNPNPEPAPTPSPAPAAPPAAKTVLNGDRTEREVQLEQELETERSGRKKAETDAAYAQDELRRLKEVQSNPPPKTKKSSRWTLLHEEEA